MKPMVIPCGKIRSRRKRPKQVWHTKQKRVRSRAGQSQPNPNPCRIPRDQMSHYLRLEDGLHMTEAPTSLTYTSVVSRDSVKIAFLIAALNDIDILACGIKNACLDAGCRERIWFEVVPERDELRGKPHKLVRALCGLKASGAAWRVMFSHFTQENLKFTPTRIDPDVYMRMNCLC